MCTSPTMVGTGGGMGMGVLFATVKSVKETGSSIAVTAILLSVAEGKTCHE